MFSRLNAHFLLVTYILITFFSNTALAVYVYNGGYYNTKRLKGENKNSIDQSGLLLSAR